MSRSPKKYTYINCIYKFQNAIDNFDNFNTQS